MMPLICACGFCVHVYVKLIKLTCSDIVYYCVNFMYMYIICKLHDKYFMKNHLEHIFAVYDCLITF